MYCIVSFPDEQDSVAVVPRSWILDNGNCLWPPFSKGKLENAVKKSLLPAALNEWRQVREKVKKIFGTYEQARGKLNKSTLTSELSDSEDDKIIRKRNASKRQEDFSMGLGNENTLVSIPKPPKISKIVQASSSNGSDSGTSQVSLVEIARPDEPSNQDPSETPAKPSNQDPSETPAKPSNQDPSETPAKPSNQDPSETLQNKTTTASMIPYIVEVHSCEKTAESTAAILAELKLKMASIEAKLDNVQEFLFQRASVNEEWDLEGLPFEEDTKLLEFPAQVQADTDFRSKLTTRWAHLGGKKLSLIVGRMMADLMVDSLGALYSLKGKRGNKCFESLGLLPIIWAAVKKSWKASTVTKSDLEGHVSDWLRHSRGRLDGKAPKADKNLTHERAEGFISEESDS